MDKVSLGAAVEQARGYAISHIVLTPTTGLSLTGHRLTRTSSLPPSDPAHTEHDQYRDNYHAEDQDLESGHGRIPSAG